MTIHYFQEQHQKLSQDIQQMKKKSNLYSLLRFLFAFGVIADLLIGYFQKNSMLYILSGICLILFMVLVVIHQRLNVQLKYNLALQDVYYEHILRKQDQWSEFQEDGSLFIDEKDYPSLDLDVFGHHSLFQLINLTFTRKGKERLAYYLKSHDMDIKTLKNRQMAVQELSEHHEFIIKMQSFGRMIHESKETIIQLFIDSTKTVQFKKISMGFIVLPCLTFISILCLILSVGYPYSFVLCEIVIFLQLILSLIFAGKHSTIFEPVSKLSKGLKSYLSIFELIQKEEFKSPLLVQIKKEVLLDSDAIKGIEKLSQISDRLMYRQNLFAFLFLNALGLYDFWMRNQYIKWLLIYQNSIEKWFDGLSEIEVLMSLSVLKIDDFDVNVPQIVETQSLSFEHLRHPLIVQDKVIGNDFTMHHHVSIITGSNMSGKTTFMRTIGLNLILAYAGGYVFANQFTCSMMHIMSSMRVKDNVEEGISTFYGELLRIKDMIEYAKLNKPMICFIDEIFKGTNSLDRIAGAKATVEKLSLSHCITFLTTHDFELCEMHNIQFDNYHFDEYYKDKQIYFDYRIKNGKSESTNGQFLLKQLGIIEEDKI